MKNFLYSIVLGLGLLASVNAQVVLKDKVPNLSALDVLSNKQVSLEKITQGKIAIYEWFNHECPFVQKHYVDSNNMQETQAKVRALLKAREIVWVSVASSGKTKSGKAKEGYLEPVALAEKVKSLGSKADYVLYDVDGRIGRAFGAKTTPHLFIFAKNGKLSYRGAIDSEASADVEDIKISKNYVLEVTADLVAGKEVSKETDSYGCSVKYSE